MESVLTTSPAPWQAPAEFPKTHWSLVLAARTGDPATSELALADLCRTYWPPLYGFLRQLGQSPEDAKDLTQGFFAQLFRYEWLENVEREKGRFRTFLLRSMENFLRNAHDAQVTQKRGGGAVHVTLDGLDLEHWYTQESASEFPAEKLYDRGWAVTLVQQTLTKLAQEYAACGRTPLFMALRDHLEEEPAAGFYAALATEFNMESGSLRVSLHRLRRRFRELLWKEVAATVRQEADVAEEIRYLFSVLEA